MIAITQFEDLCFDIMRDHPNKSVVQLILLLLISKKPNGITGQELRDLIGRHIEIGPTLTMHLEHLGLVTRQKTKLKLDYRRLKVQNKYYPTSAIRQCNPIDKKTMDRILMDMIKINHQHHRASAMVCLVLIAVYHRNIHTQAGIRTFINRPNPNNSDRVLNMMVECGVLLSISKNNNNLIFGVAK